MNNFEKVKEIDQLLVRDKVINKTNLIFSDFFSTLLTESWMRVKLVISGRIQSTSKDRIWVGGTTIDFIK